jgi:hypothetical protein
MVTITENSKITTNWKMIFTLVSVICIVGIGWKDSNDKQLQNNIAITQLQRDFLGLKNEIERNRIERIKSIDDLREENSSQHATLSSGQDRIINILLNRGR